MKEFYLLVEKTYCDPENYPEFVRGNGTHDHQTEEIAWGYLGTEPRMLELTRLFEAAKAAADSDKSKRNIDLFEKGTWSYMLAGRQKYLAGVKQRYEGRRGLKTHPVRQPAPWGWEQNRLVRGSDSGRLALPSGRAGALQPKCPASIGRKVSAY